MTWLWRRSKHPSQGFGHPKNASAEVPFAYRLIHTRTNTYRDIRLALRALARAFLSARDAAGPDVELVFSAF